MINPNPGAYPQTHPFIAREESEELNGYRTGDTVSDSSDDQNLSDEKLYPIPLALPAFFLPPVTAPIPIPQVHNITEEIASFCHLIEQIVGLEEPSLLKYALKKVEQALSKRPENPCFLACKGLLLQCNWNETEAILCINKALMIDPKNPFALMYHSYLLLRDNHIKSSFYLPDDLAKAKKDIDLSLRLRSNSCLTHSLLAKICLLKRALAKEPDDSYLLKAYSEITQALMLNQNDIYAYKMQAKYDVEANPKALFLCQNTRTKLKKLERKNNFLLRKRFGFGEESRTLTKKINEYTLQIEKHNKIIILNLRARLYMQRANFGDLENAMKDALEVLRQEPNNVNALIIKAEVKYKLTLNDDFDDSLRMVNDAFMVCPLNNQAFLLKCEILFAKGKESDLTLAILLINVVLKDNPSDRNALMLKLAIF